MWLKVYFWILLVLSVLGLFSLVANINAFSLGDWLGIAINLILILAVYSVVYKKEVFSKQVWKIIAWIMVVNAIIELDPTGTCDRIFTFIAPKITSTSYTGTIVQFILASPALYSLYKLSFKPTNTSRKSK